MKIGAEILVPLTSTNENAVVGVEIIRGFLNETKLGGRGGRSGKEVTAGVAVSMIEEVPLTSSDGKTSKV